MAFVCVYGFMAITMDSARLLVIGVTMYHLVMLGIFVLGPIYILEKVRVFLKLFSYSRDTKILIQMLIQMYFCFIKGSNAIESFKALRVQEPA